MRNRERGLDLGGSSSGQGVRRIGAILGLAFVIVLAAVVGFKMSAEAMAVVIGVVCGVAAAIPTSLLLLVVITRQDRQRMEQMEAMGRRAGQDGYPPVVVIQGGSPQALPPGAQAGYWPSPAPGPMSQRDFHVVGEEDLFIEGNSY
jgi:hypothetical protein